MTSKPLHQQTQGVQTRILRPYIDPASLGVERDNTFRGNGYLHSPAECRLSIIAATKRGEICEKFT